MVRQSRQGFDIARTLLPISAHPKRMFRASTRLRFPGKASDSGRRLICRNAKSEGFRFSTDTKVKRFLIKSPAFGIPQCNCRISNSTNDRTWRLRRRTISPVRLVPPEVSFPRPKTIRDTTPRGVRGRFGFGTTRSLSARAETMPGSLSRSEHRRERLADRW